MPEMNPSIDNSMKWCSVELCSKLFHSQFKTKADPVNVLQNIIIKPFVSRPIIELDFEDVCDDLYN